MKLDAEILHLYISPGHNFFGHHGQPAGRHPIVEVPEIRGGAGEHDRPRPQHARRDPFTLEDRLKLVAKDWGAHDGFRD